MDVDDVIEMARNLLELLFDIGPHRRGDFDMMTGKRQLHGSSPFLAYLLHFAISTWTSLPLPCVHSKARVPAPRGTSPPCGAPPRCLRRRAAPRSGCRKAGC